MARGSVRHSPQVLVQGFRNGSGASARTNVRLFISLRAHANPDGKSPYEMRFGKPRDISGVSEWGAPCYAYVFGKLEPNAERVYWLAMTPSRRRKATGCGRRRSRRCASSPPYGSCSWSQTVRKGCTPRRSAIFSGMCRRSR
ncbi:hypothetical protein AURDEDRAFT_147612 [Auricularia subglabra TFB-10046 SS5]|uniref:Uncharacterized protein n=1 Tax=Auricularia subglabra (strain TFB-10046 / SS5) TaxID=717982 RepID=J0LB92_AURST|nr:hypothetical protein AURDEDRAFT_147612 [Auricularia subglabra TFB-10046 SS5]